MGCPEIYYKQALKKLASGLCGTGHVSPILEENDTDALENSECINKAIENGEYYCWCNNCLHNQAINKLKKLGYAVTNCSTQRDGDCFKIEW